jgi:site-specific DNA recombinase
MGQDLTVLVAPVGALNMYENITSTILCRVSTKEQSDTGYSLPAQQKLLSDYAAIKGLANKKTFSISESASGHKQRKVFQELLTYLYKSNIKVLVVEKTDRLTRNHKDAVAINTWIEEDPEREVHFVKENFILRRDSKSNEKFIWNIKVSVAQYYLDNLSEEVKKGQKEKLAQGWLPTKPPLGYKTVGEKGKRIHVIDDETKHYAERMFTLYDSGEYSVKRLAKRLYEEGLRSVNGNRVPHSRIHEYLIDPFYIGKNKWNGHVTPGSQEALIQKAMFDRVQKRLKGRTTPKYNKHNFLFKGLIRCRECGGLITWEIQKGIVYGHCNHYKDCSQKVWAKEPEVENQLIDCFDMLQIRNKCLLEWIRKALRESHKDEIEYYEKAAGELNKREDQIKTRLSRLYDDKVDGKITENFYDSKFAEYSEEREEIASLRTKHNRTDEKYYQLGATLYDISQKAKEIYKNADVVKKKRLLRLVFKRMQLDEGTLSYEHTEPFKLLSEAISATNSSKVVKTGVLNEKTFELAKNVVRKGNSGGTVSVCPSWLPPAHATRTEEWVRGFVFSKKFAGKKIEILNAII